ncbi:hypothetical protein LINPERHAP1_LOCUS16329, partial [Linum perenne]
FRKLKRDPSLTKKYTTPYYLGCISHLASYVSYALMFWYYTPLVFTFDIGAAVAFGTGVVAEILLFRRVRLCLECRDQRYFI